MFLYTMDLVLSHKWLKLIISMLKYDSLKTWYDHFWTFIWINQIKIMHHHIIFLISYLVLLKSDIKFSVSCVSNRKKSINLGPTTVLNGAKLKKTVTLARFARIKIVSEYLSIYPSFFIEILIGLLVRLAVNKLPSFLNSR